MSDIELLNGEKWQVEDLLFEMRKDDFYYGFLGQNALSSSSLKKLLESPKAYQASLRQSDSSQALRDGRLIHLSILEPERLSELTIIDGTKAKKEFKEAVAEQGEEYVYTRSEFNSAQWVAEAIHQNNEASFLLDGCNFEVPGIGMVHDLPFRAKADALADSGNTIIDLKTTSAPISEFHWSAKKYNYALQAALYLEIFQADTFVFLVINKITKDIGIFECSKGFLEGGSVDIMKAVSVYKEFFNKENTEELLKNNVVRGIL